MIQGRETALMAKQGIIGPENCFEGRAGLFNVYFGGDVDRNALMRDLGATYNKFCPIR